jgi:colanic acid biosynthesis protein WcaH
MTGELGTRVFLDVVRHAPLVSVDLVVRRPSGECLLGWRRNPPARGWWFVPGGRVRKNEPIGAALERITRGELGLRITLDQTRFLGVYEHIYDDNAGNEPGFGTHYVVLAFELMWSDDRMPRPDDQHDRFRWAGPAEMLADETIHPFSRAYLDRGSVPVAGGAGFGS